MSRAFTSALLSLLLAATLAACGGGGSSSETTAATRQASGPPAAPKPAAPSQASAAKARADRRLAGRAAPFVIPEADNSVPIFGRESSPSERAAAERSLKAYLGARARGDWTSACRALAGPTREGYEKLGRSSSKAGSPSCATVLAALSKGTDTSDPLTGHLLALRIDGINAFALFYGPGHQRYMVPMNREGAMWRPTQAAPIAYPPGAAGGG